ncbi:MAG TPA: serine hydroxymethyltransferase [Candidatus Babeliales bacterium]|jgi:glycine hydroxymethyltransferase|nr:serine hydroxymethyltransferase [Candidatus Babeliales bacterium]
MNLNITDPQLFQLIDREKHRQEDTINLIASENYASLAVMEATASVLTNKYAEGYAGKRYYPGCAVIDEVELLAIDRCKQLFHAEHVNVQPHSGSQANMGVYFSLLAPGDTILGMSLSSGGHLTHGHGVNFSGTLFKSVQYTVDQETELLDYDAIEKLAQECQPKLIICGASAYSRIIDFEKLACIAQSVNALLLADIAHIVGLVAAGLHPSPINYADFTTSTTHKTLRGPRGGLIMTSAAYGAKIDRAIMPGMQGGPLMNTIAAKAVAFHEALQPSFITYQKQIIANAKSMADELITLGYRIVAGGTDNHLFIVDLRSKGVTGLKAEIALEKAGITVTRSCIPFDPEKPWITSGIRLGTPAITTRGMQVEIVRQIAHLIDDVIRHHDNDVVLAAIKIKVRVICAGFPIFDGATRR